MFLQGPISPFFNELASEILKQNLVSVYKLQFCYSDQLWWNHELIKYKGEQKLFDSFIISIIKKHGITDIVLLGENRPYHKIAIKEAKLLGCNVWTFEEGYLRPNTITLALNAKVNGNGKKISFDKSEGNLSLDEILNVDNSLLTRLRWDFFYHILNFLYKYKFPHYRHHRPANVWKEYLGWLSRFSKKFFYQDRFVLNKKVKLTKANKYFLVPLQLSHDYQIIMNSRYNNILEMIDEVIESYSRSVSDDTMLVFKVHPLDTFVINPIKHIKSVLRNVDKRERVLIIDGGNLDILIEEALAIVTVNSTVGLASLIKGKATYVLGDAVYNIPRLVQNDDLDSFWSEYKAPCYEDVNILCDYLIREFLFNGSFYSLEGIKMLVPEVSSYMLKKERGLD